MPDLSNVNDSEPTDPTARRVHDSNYVLNELKRLFVESKDVFDKQIADGTANQIDLASHYPQNPERWRVFVDGSRQLLQYTSIDQYTHTGDVHELSPNAGETVTFESTERPRYVVQYETAVTWAFAVTQSLQSGDRIRIGLFDDDDGWFFEHTGAHADQEGDFVVRRNANEVARTSDQDIAAAVTRFARFALGTGWYDITRQEWKRSFSEDGEQRNPTVGRTSVDDGRGPAKGNLPLRFEVTASDTTTDLTLEAGSAALVTLGAAEPITRTKGENSEGSIDVSGEWVPVEAYRVDPGRKIVNTQVLGFTLRKTTTSADTFLLFQVFDPSNVQDANGNELTDADFDPPNPMSGSNSVVQSSQAVDQVANADGVVSTSVADPGGYQLQTSSIYTGSGQSRTQSVNTFGVPKRELSSRDVGVVLAKSNSTGDISYDIRFEQDW